MTYQDYLEQIYYDPQHPGSFGGVAKLYKAVHQEGKYVLGKATTRTWLETQETFVLYSHALEMFISNKKHEEEFGYYQSTKSCFLLFVPPPLLISSAFSFSTVKLWYAILNNNVYWLQTSKRK